MCRASKDRTTSLVSERPWCVRGAAWGGLPRVTVSDVAVGPRVAGGRPWRCAARGEAGGAGGPAACASEREGKRGARAPPPRAGARCALLRGSAAGRGRRRSRPLRAPRTGAGRWALGAGRAPQPCARRKQLPAARVTPARLWPGARALPSAPLPPVLTAHCCMMTALCPAEPPWARAAGVRDAVPAGVCGPT